MSQHTCHNLKWVTVVCRKMDKGGYGLFLAYTDEMFISMRLRTVNMDNIQSQIRAELRRSVEYLNVSVERSSNASMSGVRSGLRLGNHPHLSPEKYSSNRQLEIVASQYIGMEMTTP